MKKMKHGGEILLEKNIRGGDTFAEINYDEKDGKYTVKLYREGGEGWKTKEGEFEKYTNKIEAIDAAKKWWKKNKDKYIYSVMFIMDDELEKIEAEELGYTTDDFDKFEWYVGDWDDAEVEYLDGSIESFSAEEKGGFSPTRQAQSDENKVEEIRDDVLHELNKIYGIKDKKYQTLGVLDEGGKLLGTIGLRIADHSENPRNIDWRGGERDRFLSVVFSSDDPTEGRWDLERHWRTESQIKIDETDTPGSALEKISGDIDSFGEDIKYDKEYEGDVTITTDYDDYDKMKHGGEMLRSTGNVLLDTIFAFPL